MFRTCVTCGQRTIVAWQIDGAITLMDAAPVTDGQAVLKGDLQDQPTVLFGIDTEGDAEYFQVPFESERYDRHECAEGANP